jgi:hypothetical protein
MCKSSSFFSKLLYTNIFKNNLCAYYNNNKNNNSSNDSTNNNFLYNYNNYTSAQRQKYNYANIYQDIKKVGKGTLPILKNIFNLALKI